MPEKKKKKVTAFRRIFSIILFILLLPFIILIGLFVFAYKFDKRKKFEKSDNKGKTLIQNSDSTSIDIMQGYEFEELVRAVYFYLGYGAQLTKKSNDFGADIILTDKNNNKIVIQTKRYNKHVGARSVQEVASARAHYNANEAWVVTNSSFTDAAELLAKETDVRLIDRDEFLEDFLKVKQSFSSECIEYDNTNFGASSEDFGQGQYRI